MTEINVKGLADLQKFMDTLAPKIERNIMRGALRAGVKPILTQAKLNAPVGAPSSTGKKYGGYAGALRDSIRISTGVRGGKITASVKAGGKTNRASVFYAIMVEYGTDAHWIRVKKSARPTRLTRRGMKAFSIRTLNTMAKRGSLKIGSNFVGESIEHPGARSRTFLRPALDSQARNAIIAAAEYIKKRLATKQGLDASGIEISIGDES